jgi:hypothetical protein
MSAAPCYLNKENSTPCSDTTLDATPLSQQAVAPPGPSLSTARRVDALPLLSGVLPTVFSVISPRTCYREIGPREIARLTVLSLGEQTPKSRWSKVNLGVFPLAPRALTYQFPECRNSDVTRARHLDSTMPPGSHSATSPSGLRGSRNPRLQVSCCWKPRMPNPRCSGFVPPVPPGSTVPIKSGDRTSRFRRACDSCTRQPRFADMRWPRVPLCT